MNGLVLFKRYTWGLNALELNVFIALSLFITIRKVYMLKSKTSLLGGEQCDRMKTSFSSQQLALSPLPI
jgi:hypothetical protein